MDLERVFLKGDDIVMECRAFSVNVLFFPPNYRVRCKKYYSFCNALVIDFIGVYFLLQLLFIATNTQKKYCLFKEFFKIQKFLMVKLSYLYRLCSP